MKTVYAYLARIIDIDGYIFIGRTIKYPRGKNQPDSYSYFPTIGISSTSSVVPDLFQKTFPARRREFHPRDTQFTGWHWWEAEHESARRPLISLAPFLRIKRPQAELVLLLLDLIADQSAVRSPGMFSRGSLRSHTRFRQSPPPFKSRRPGAFEARRDRLDSGLSRRRRSSGSLPKA